jgi:hypothetical protein
MRAVHVLAEELLFFHEGAELIWWGGREEFASVFRGGRVDAGLEIVDPLAEGDDLGIDVFLLRPQGLEVAVVKIALHVEGEAVRAMKSRLGISEELLRIERRVDP